MEPKWISNSALLIIILSLQFELSFGFNTMFYLTLSIPGCLICCCICVCICLCCRVYSDEDYSKQQVGVIIVQSPNVPANPAPMAPTYIPHSQAGVKSVPKKKLEVVNDVPADPEAKTSANLSHPRAVDTQVVLPTRRSFPTSYPSDHPVFIRDPRKAYL